MTKEQEMMERIHHAVTYVQNRIKTVPEVAIVLGSGLGGFVDKCVQVTDILPYSEIPGFPVSTVAGHKGCFVFGKIEEKNVVIMQGRVHYYEGYSMQEVVLPIRLMKCLGASVLVLTNAAGGINETYTPGDLVQITDQITSFVPSALIGENLSDLGTRFPDMSHVYDEELGKLLHASAKKHDITLKKGVYLQTTGPNYETPAEIRMFRTFGADCVGMSTTCEAMAARHMGMRIAGVSCITNMAAGVQKTELNHREVSETANRVARNFETLIYDFVASL